MSAVDGVDGVQVDPEQIRTHASHIDELRNRFAAVKAASSHIAGDESAYGTLCGWIAGVLAGRHARQDELIAYVEENLSLVAAALRETADVYTIVDGENADLVNEAGSPLS